MKRQYVGCAGQVANAINIVYCTYASSREHGQVGARAYLPKEWAADPERRARAGVGEEVVFKTKPRLAVDILTDLDTAGVLPPWVTGDEMYAPRQRTVSLLPKTAASATCSVSPARSPSR